MNVYYKNWYQHYLELEKEKEKEIQKGYYSNLAPKEDKAEIQISKGRKKEKSPVLEVASVISLEQKKRKFSLLGLLLPVSTALGFIFLWYQMDVEPVRHIVNEVLVISGVREEAIDVVSLHTSLLDQHVEFADNVANYIHGEGELSWDELELMYNEIRATHTQVVEYSKEEHAEVLRLWSFKIASTNQMMSDLISDEDVGVAHVQFIVDQQAIAVLIREELMIGEDI